jgi:23S rRNA pseudouridine2605 synthase
MNEETNPGREVREGERIAKVMARAGLCSRRDAEAWIAAGRVSVNGTTLMSPAYNVSDADDILVDGKRLAERERTRLFLFHKPRGLVTTARDPEGRLTIFDALPADLPRVVAIGRLDINTEGLLLLTNDGGLARVLELPATGWLRRYRVRAHGAVDQARLDALREGISIDGVDYAGIEARLDREQGSNAWLTLGLREGKNREIKKVLEHLGLAVNRLIRISFGPFELGDLAEGEAAEAPTRVLREQLGVKLAREAGADFDAPVIKRAAPAPEPRANDNRNMERRQHESGSRERTPDARRGHGQDRRQGRPDSSETPRRAAPARSTPDRRRKHVSALRAEIAAEASGPRKRVERSATRDRKGRQIAVERVTSAGEKTRGRAAAKTRGRGAFAEGGRARAASPPGPGRQNFDARPEGENRARRSKRFENQSPRDGDRRERASQFEARERGPRQRRFDAPDAERRGERPQRAPRSDARVTVPGEPGRPQRERRGEGGKGGAASRGRFPPARGPSPGERPRGKRPTARPDGDPRRPPRKPR